MDFHPNNIVANHFSFDLVPNLRFSIIEEQDIRWNSEHERKSLPKIRNTKRLINTEHNHNFVFDMGI